MWVLAGLGLISLAAWLGVLLMRGGFWRPGPWLPAAPPETRAGWPAVAAVVPARDEAELLPATLTTLLAQNYPGEFRVVLVDDASGDGTATVAREVADSMGEANPVPLTVVDGVATPASWAGKVWAMQQGVQNAGSAQWLFFTDADIAHAPDVVHRLVSLALGDRRDLVSVMAELRAKARWERLLVPSFVYFFAMLYPFRWVARGRTPAAAGGCLLVRAGALRAAGGLEAMRAALIDDVTLAQQVAASGGRLWLGFDPGVRSLRAYPKLRDLWHMVSRSAYTELDYSPWRLTGALAGLALLFAVPLVDALAGLGAVAWQPTPEGSLTLATGIAAWLVQTVTYAPVVRRIHRLPLRWAVTLPLAGLLYAAITASSAVEHHRGTSTPWKGRQSPTIATDD